MNKILLLLISVLVIFTIFFTWNLNRIEVSDNTETEAVQETIDKKPNPEEKPEKNPTNENKQQNNPPNSTNDTIDINNPLKQSEPSQNKEDEETIRKVK
ncbi:MAG: hypothetical protein ACQEP9_02190 [Bacillota bacterium]